MNMVVRNVQLTFASRKCWKSMLDKLTMTTLFI